MLRLRGSLVALALFGLPACHTTPTSLNTSVVESWMPQLRQADIVIVGETHDNAVHHIIQADIIDRLDPFGVVFEMVPAALTETANQAVATGEDLRAALDWDKSSWPDWSIYEPVFTASQDAQIIGAGVEKADVRRAMSDGADVVSGLSEAYGLADPLPEAQKNDIVDEMIKSHCGMIPQSVASQMVEAQRLRDATFAAATVKTLEDAQGEGPIVLITGTGHARRDRGVPAYLARIVPDANVISIGLVEQDTITETELYDIIHAVVPAKRDDPCAQFLATPE